MKTEYETCSNNEWQEVSRGHSTVVLQIIYNFMLHIIHNYCRDYPECHITLFNPNYAH